MTAFYLIELREIFGALRFGFTVLVPQLQVVAIVRSVQLLHCKQIVTNINRRRPANNATRPACLQMQRELA